MGLRRPHRDATKGAQEMAMASAALSLEPCDVPGRSCMCPPWSQCPHQYPATKNMTSTHRLQLLDTWVAVVQQDQHSRPQRSRHNHMALLQHTALHHKELLQTICNEGCHPAVGGRCSPDHTAVCNVANSGSQPVATSTTAANKSPVDSTIKTFWAFGSSSGDRKRQSA